MKVLTESPWDGGIITEGVKPDTGKPDQEGRGFATAAGYVGHAICDSTEWINGLSNPVGESYHPNKLWHSLGYTPVVRSVLG